MKFKRHKNVEALLENALPNAKEAIRNMDEMYEKDAMSRHLFLLRTRVGVSQKELADRLGVSQSIISKMENKGEYLKFNDAIRYVHALGYSTEVAFIKGGRRVDFLGSYFTRIKRTMDDLQGLAGGDPDITRGVMTAFLQFSKSLLEDVVPQIKEKEPRTKSPLMISMAPDKSHAEPVKARRKKVKHTA